ncbi:unnamed protein product, partial [Musa banksii]
MKAVVRLLPALFILQAIFVATTGDARYLREHSRCDEFYAAEEGETLQTISVKCNNIFILEDNPQINDTDDIGPGTVLYMQQIEKREGRGKVSTLRERRSRTGRVVDGSDLVHAAVVPGAVSDGLVGLDGSGGVSGEIGSGACCRPRSSRFSSTRLRKSHMPLWLRKEGQRYAS